MERQAETSVHLVGGDFTPLSVSGELNYHTRCVGSRAAAWPLCCYENTIEETAALI
jgi:hypothetical protein